MFAAHDSAIASRSDALIIGAGPAGASAAIWLAKAGWQVALVEQHAYPRQKVCGECIAAGNFALLDELGVGQAIRRHAGAELTHAGWMGVHSSVTAKMPPCAGIDPYGRALGRDVFDELLLERARALGVRILQPARVRKVSGRPGDFSCDIEEMDSPRSFPSPAGVMTKHAAVVIDAHGSWEAGPRVDAADSPAVFKRRPRASDLFAFKATFANTGLPVGWLPVIALKGGYGGMVVSNAGRTTLALCLRRDALRALRLRAPGLSAGLAVEAYLRESCHGAREALEDATRKTSWLTVGPLRPGMRSNEVAGIFRVGNAAGESHPLIGEGISMALQSSKLLVDSLVRNADRKTDSRSMSKARKAYARSWRRTFMPRLWHAALYAHLAMRAPLAAPVGECLRLWPALLTTAARLAGKSRLAVRFQAQAKEII